jgi:hypothetical protein
LFLHFLCFDDSNAVFIIKGTVLTFSGAVLRFKAPFCQGLFYHNLSDVFFAFVIRFVRLLFSDVCYDNVRTFDSCFLRLHAVPAGSV